MRNPSDSVVQLNHRLQRIARHPPSLDNYQTQPGGLGWHFAPAPFRPCRVWHCAPCEWLCRWAGVQKADSRCPCCTHTATSCVLWCGRQYQERYEVPAAMPARPNRRAVILYPNHPLSPSPNPVPTRSFAGSRLSETADRAILTLQMISNPEHRQSHQPQLRIHWARRFRRIKVCAPDARRDHLACESRDNLHRRTAFSAHSHTCAPLCLRGWLLGSVAGCFLCSRAPCRSPL